MHHDGETIVFVSARCRRIVNCHTTDTAVLHWCDADGSNIRPLSSNNQPDNTPWPLPNGQILYTRWEYVQGMRRYGMLPVATAEDAAVDVYALEETYWESLWYRP